MLLRPGTLGIKGWSEGCCRAPMRIRFPRWRSPAPLEQRWLKHFLTWRRKTKGTEAWIESTVREAPAPKMLCEPGRLWSALEWANVRRLVVNLQPGDDGASTPA